MWWSLSNKDKKNNKEDSKDSEEQKTSVVHDPVNESFSLEVDTKNSEDKKEVKIPDCENLIKVMRECTKKNDGTHNCKKEIDDWEKNCKKTWFS